MLAQNYNKNIQRVVVLSLLLLRRNNIKDDDLNWAWCSKFVKNYVVSFSSALGQFWRKLSCHLHPCVLLSIRFSAPCRSLWIRRCRFPFLFASKWHALSCWSVLRRGWRSKVPHRIIVGGICQLMSSQKFFGNQKSTRVQRGNALKFAVWAFVRALGFLSNYNGILACSKNKIVPVLSPVAVVIICHH